LKVIDDQVGAPTGADLLADVTAHAVSAIGRRPDLSGTYHVAARGETSWFEYARFVIESARARGWTLTVPAEGLCPIATSAYPTAARRPQNSRLDCAKLERAFGLCMPSWQSGVGRLIDELGLE
jgi:dTDP-4-dehydrorhamnose reductase